MSESQSETVVVSGSLDAIEAIRREIDSHAGAESVMSERKNYDGSVAEWIAIGNLTISALTFVLAVVKEVVASKKVKKIRVGDVEIENPSTADIELLRTSIQARLSSPPPQ
jgi:hypothetical protein